MEGRLLCVAIGYLFGCVLTADIVARVKIHRSAADIGTGNPGMANIMEQLGFKAGIVTLLGDIGKTVLMFLTVRAVCPGLGTLAVAYGGFGTILGHNFPFWRKFKGGMGVAVTCSVIVLISPVWGMAANLLGGVTVLIFHYLATAAVLIPGAFIAPAFIFYGREVGWLAVAWTVLMAYEHSPGLIRMTKGTEKPVDIIGKIKKNNKK